MLRNTNNTNIEINIDELLENVNVKEKQRKIDTSKLGRSNVHRAIKHFIEKPNENKVFGSYFVQDKTLTYRECGYGMNFRVELIAVTVDSGVVIGNSTASRIQETKNNVTKGQQALIDLGIPMIPFKVFKDAGLNIQEFKLIEQCLEETIKRNEVNPCWIKWNNKRTYGLSDKKLEEHRKKEPKKDILVDVHFIGASLFEVGGKYFLFDIDRNEIKHGIFNPFMTEIPKPCKTVAEAYESLIPKEVKDAMNKGLDVKRQGEWFLIPVKGNYKADLTPKEDVRWLGKYRPLTLQAGPNRPNHAQYGVQAKNLVKGKFEHSGREHKTIVLKTWHKAIPNTAVNSFTIEGDVD